jgi:hypothetical protein
MLRHRGLSRRAVAALEFALVAPVVVIMIISVFEICKALIIRQEVINTAHSISLTASLIAVQANGTTSLTQSQVQAVESDIFAEIPWLRDGVEKATASVTLSGVEFSEVAPTSPTQPALSTTTPCQPYTGCKTNYTPYVAWSVAYKPLKAISGVTFNYGSGYTRPCGAVTNVWDINTNSTSVLTLGNFMTTLRTASIVYPDPILVADVSYTETVASFPLNLFTGGKLTFIASAYWPVRVIPFNANSTPDDQIGSGELTTYDTAGTDTSTNAHCTAEGLP